jgi:ElaB/YqjD/DUF883 family membrane-anchored ribosome-binding protein
LTSCNLQEIDMATDTKQDHGSNGPLKAHLGDAVDEVAERMSEMKARASDSLAVAIKDLGAAMSRHPVATVAIGVGAGYVLARLLARR